MSKDVSKICYAASMIDSGSTFREAVNHFGHGFANDFKNTLDGAAQLTVGEIVGQLFAMGIFLQLCKGVCDVMQVHTQVSLHRSSLGRIQPPFGNKGFGSFVN